MGNFAFWLSLFILCVGGVIPPEIVPRVGPAVRFSQTAIGDAAPRVPAIKASAPVSKMLKLQEPRLRGTGPLILQKSFGLQKMEAQLNEFLSSSSPFVGPHENSKELVRSTVSSADPSDASGHFNKRAPFADKTHSLSAGFRVPVLAVVLAALAAAAVRMNKLLAYAQTRLGATTAPQSHVVAAQAFSSAPPTGLMQMTILNNSSAESTTFAHGLVDGDGRKLAAASPQHTDSGRSMLAGEAIAKHELSRSSAVQLLGVAPAVGIAEAKTNGSGIQQGKLGSSSDISGSVSRLGLAPAGVTQSPRCRVALLALRERTTPRAPRQRRQSEAQKRADAIVHAVVAVELLDWHDKLGSTLETTFRKAVYTPVVPRLRRLTARSTSAQEDFRMDANGKFGARPSRVHDQILERQFTLGNVFTTAALEALQRTDDSSWFRMAQYRSRQELLLAKTPQFDDPQAKDLVGWCQGVFKLGNGDTVEVADRAVGHNDAKECIWMLPIFVDHDRSAHAERQALLTMLEALPMADDEGVAPDIHGKARVYASHTPCISCLSTMMQFTRAFENAKIAVTFDTWKETRRWIGLAGITDEERAESQHQGGEDVIDV